MRLFAARRVRRSTDGDRATTLMTAAFVCVAVSLGVLAARSGISEFAAASVIPLAVIAAFAERHAVMVSSRLQISATAPLIVIGAVVGGPLGGFLVALVGLVADLSGPPQRWLTHVSMFTSMGAIGGFAAAFAGPVDGTLSQLAGRALIASLAVFLANMVGGLVIGVVRQIRPFRAFYVLMTATMGMSCVLSIPLALAMAYGVERVGAIVLLLVVLPTAASGALIRLYREKVALAIRLSEGNMTFALSLVRALDARDTHTAGHSAAVAVYARDVALKLGLASDEVAKIQLAALLHDIGKIGVPSEVLHKEGELDEAEWELIRNHPEVGASIAGEAPIFREIAELIRSHHERPDGRGYPAGLGSDQIPLASAVIGIADAYNAMTSHRPYRAALSPEEAMEELRRGAGSQFEATLVPIFLTVLRAHDVDYQLGTGARFSIDGQRTAILRELGDPAPARALAAAAA
jgi:putative nucleotidyltransferase with HDIG domain